MGSVKYSEARYKEIKETMFMYLKKVGYKPKKIPFIPISGWEGDNMLTKSTNMGWYKGPCLIEALNSVKPPKRPIDKPSVFLFRMYTRLEALELSRLAVSRPASSNQA